MIKSILYAGFFAGVIWAQAPGKLEFEVASVRMIQEGTPAPANLLAEFNFGPLNQMEDIGAAARKGANISEPRNPNRILLPFVPLAFVVQLAFGTLGHESVRLRAPDWIDDLSRVYTIEAVTPVGTTGLQAQDMLRNLLIDRFGMKFHTETVLAEVYKITRDERQPLKLKESVGPATLAPPGFKPTRDSDGMPTFPPGVTRLAIFSAHARLQAVNLPMSEIAKFLGSALGADVIDETDLMGKYSFQLDFDPAHNLPPALNVEPAPPLDKALRPLGLALTKRKGEVGITVIDAINKTPSEN